MELGYVIPLPPTPSHQGRGNYAGRYFAKIFPGHNTSLADPATFLGARPDLPDRAASLFFFTASSVFLLGMLELLGYIYLDQVRKRLYHWPGRRRPEEEWLLHPYHGVYFTVMPDLMPNPDKHKAPEAGLTPEPQGISWWQSKAALWALLALILLGLGLLFWAFHYRSFLWGQVCHYFGICTNKQWIKSVLKAAGPLAPLVFILIQGLQVVFAPIPGEATGFIGGYLFGAPLGLLYSTLGLTLGSVLAFLIARWLEEHYVRRWIPAEILQKFDFLMERQGALVAFILFLLPGFPKDYLCFVLGLSRMPLKLFLLICTVGRLPGTLLLTLQGAKVYKGDYYSTLTILGLCLVLILVLGYYREPVYRWIRRFDHPEEKAPETK